MRLGVRIAALLLAVPLALSTGLAPAAAQDDGSTQAPDDWEPWFNDSHTMRVPIEVSPGEAYPNDWDGPRLVAHELDLTTALQQAGWPTDAGGNPQDFSLEADSVRVVPVGVDDPEPATAITWQGPVVSERGTFPANHEVFTVAFLAERGIDEYHVYVDQREDDVTHDPPPRDPLAEQRILQLIAGPGAGHEVYGIAQGNVEFTVGSGYSTTVTAQRLTGDGWAALNGCGGSVSATDWNTCSATLPPSSDAEFTPVRFTADRPISVHGMKADTEPFLGLNAEDGFSNGTRLLAPHVASSGSQVVELMSTGSTCQASYSGGTTQVGDVPTRIQISSAEAITADCSILGWIPGDDASEGSTGPMPVSIGETTAISGMGMQTERVDVVAIGENGERATIVNSEAQTSDERVFNQGSPVREGHDPFRGGPWPAPNPSDDSKFRMGATGTSLWPSTWDGTGDVLPLAPTADGAIGWLGTPRDLNDPQVKVASLAFDGTAGFGAAIANERVSTDFSLLSISEAREYTSSEDTLDENKGALVEAWPQGEPRLAASYAVLQQAEPGEAGYAPSTLHGHMRPMASSAGQPQVIGPVFDVDVDPSSTVAPPGALQEFDVVGQGQFRQPTGEVSAVDVNLNVELTDLETGEEGGADADLGSATATLPIDASGSITDLLVDVPSDVDPENPPDYRIEVTAASTEGGESVTATATLQVVPNRDIRLAFEDGSSLAELETEDGTATASLVLSNEGTTVEDVRMSTVLPPGVDWDVQLLDAVSREPVELVEGLSPDASRSLELTVDAPEGATRVVDVKTIAESTADSSVSDQATARVAHEVDVDVFSKIRPDLISTSAGGQAEVNLSIVNQGSSVNVQVLPRSDENLAMEARETSVNLGENGSDLDSATVPINVSVDQQAPLGSVLVGTVALEIKVGGLEPVESLMSIRVRVVPDHSADAAGGATILPGINATAEVPVQATGDVDEDLDLDLRRVPPGWDVEVPNRLQIPRNTTAPLRLNVTTPAGTASGSYEIGLEATPRDGSDPIQLTVPVGVAESAAIRQTVAGAIELGVGETRQLVATLENRGNTAGQTTVEATSELTSVTFRPATFDLAPGATRRVEMDLEGVQAGQETLEVTSEPGGFSTMNVTVGTVDLSVTVVSTDPATPEAGESFRVVGEVANGGTVAARDVDVALVSGATIVTNETIGRVPAGETATLTLGTDDLPSTEDLRLVVDREGRYSGDEGPSGQAAVSAQETPALAPIAALAATALAAALRRRC